MSQKPICNLYEICCMVDLKFTFSNLQIPNVKKYLSDRAATGRDHKRNEADLNKDKEGKEKKLPLFYEHKIRAPKYEFF